ncbi:phosphatidylglycerophosphatase A [Candidatus Xenohaliotis californiensis]|uniref:Phosphatidylglycerophosphatase A n=1 Tax=Candidatus Xenohaliotis californiensis TaxID=84677 RepID=A0ABM9N803_9RICK|nr:phosphatidylglycerophosphatase A [Candidatus Xenohaliotis californiensis]
MRQILKNILSRIMPSSTISTCLGIGFLPEWQKHWAATLGALFCIIFIGIKAGELHHTVFDVSKVVQIVDIASTLLTIAVFSYFLGAIAKFLYMMRDGADEEKCVIDSFNGMIFICGFSLIAIFSIRNLGVGATNIICEDFLLCNSFFRHLFYSMLPLTITFSLYRLMSVAQLWPCNKLNTTLSNQFAKTLSNIIMSIYAIILIYVFAFVFFGLNVIDTIVFFKLLYKTTTVKIIKTISLFLNFSDQKQLYDILTDFGVIGILSRLGFIKLDE